MKIILTSVGTRGDMEPFLAIGEILREKGHDVICLFPEQFRSLAENCGFEFASLGTEFMEMLESEDGRTALGGGGSRFRKILAYFKLSLRQSTINRGLVTKQFDVIERESPDRIVYHSKALYPVIWSVNNPGKVRLISPVPYLHYIPGHTHLAFNSDWGTVLNKWTFSLATFGLVKAICSSVKMLGLEDKVTRRQIKEALTANGAIYTISPTLFPRPEEWPGNLQVLGYHERKKSIDWIPAPALLDFLEDHKRVLFLTFGSMTNPQPAQKTKLLLNLLERYNIPAIVNTAAGGLVRPSDLNHELFYFVDQIPYDWIFPKVYAVMHHGGSGTTHAGLKYGCATLIVPHIIDQFIWNDLIHNLGAGPKGISIGRMTDKNLEPLILELWNNPAFKKRAQQLREELRKESFRNKLYDAII